MDKVTEFFKSTLNKATKFFKANSTNIYIALAVLIVGGVFMYMYYRRSKHQIHMQLPPTEEQPMTEDFKGGKENIKIIVFYAPWCSHCKKFMTGENSVWEQLKSKYAGRKDVILDQINCDEKPELATQYGIGSFPTIMKVGENNKTDKFEGERTVEALERFVDA